MPVDRELPSQEAADLIALTRDLADANSPRMRRPTSGRSGSPGRSSPCSGRPVCSACPSRRTSAGAASRTRSTCRSSRSSPPAGRASALGVSVHTLACSPIATLRHRRAAQRPAPRHGRRPPARAPTPCRRPTRAPTSRRCAPGDPVATAAGPRAARRRGSPTAVMPTSTRPSSAHRPTAARAGSPASCCPPDLPGLQRRPARGEDGPDRLDHGGDPAGRRPDPGRPAGRRARAAAWRSPWAPSTPAGSGVSAVAVGLAQAALDVAVRYAAERTAFGRPIIDHQGLAFLLADMAAAVESARATYLVAARRKDAGKPYSRQASIAKLVATDAAMKVTTDAVQVLGGAGYTREFPVERYMREAKVMQIFEGTNQIQRMVIGRSLAQEAAPPAAGRRRRFVGTGCTLRAWPPSAEVEFEEPEFAGPRPRVVRGARPQDPGHPARRRLAPGERHRGQVPRRRAVAGGHAAIGQVRRPPPRSPDGAAQRQRRAGRLPGRREGLRPSDPGRRPGRAGRIRPSPRKYPRTWATSSSSGSTWIRWC